MLPRSAWAELARELDWDFSYVTKEEAFPRVPSGRPVLPDEAWSGWDEPFKTTFREYVTTQHDKEISLAAVRDAVGSAADVAALDPAWRSATKLHGATLPLAEFAAVIGNLRAARFGRRAAWRTVASFGALDELRHTQLPLAHFHPLVRVDPQYDWVHRFYHSDDWVAIAGRHMMDELLLGSDVIEFAIGTNFVFETAFTNLQFIGMASLAHDVGDRAFEAMLASIQTDEARHAQIGPAVLEVVAKHDPEYAQWLVDKWFWRSWILFAIVTGFTMDYLCPLEKRQRSFKEFVEEWVVAQFLPSLERYGLARPWYWDTFLGALDHYHHMVYASAYTYRASVWFDFVVPGPRERAWLRKKYPSSWDSIAPVWEAVDERWRATDVDNEFGVHGTAIIGFCDLCQAVLCGGTPDRNAASVVTHGETKRIFCSEPCRWIFEREPERYAGHRDLVKRVLAGEAPANLVAMIRRYFGLEYETWGKDIHGGDYPFIQRARP